jgi:hypothetical protein
LRSVIAGLVGEPMVSTVPLRTAHASVAEKTVAFSATIPAMPVNFEATTIQDALKSDPTDHRGGADIEI